MRNSIQAGLKTCPIKHMEGKAQAFVAHAEQQWPSYNCQQSWEHTTYNMLSLEQALGTLDQRAELPGIEGFIPILQKCKWKKALPSAKFLHAQICNSGLESHETLGNYIITMFVECGSMADAEHVFKRLAYRDEHSWTSLISGYIHSGHSQYAFNLYQEMQKENLCPSRYTLMALLKACNRLKDIGRGRQFHARIIQQQFDTDVFIGSALIDMYAKCGSLLEAQEVFDRLQARNVVLWTALIAGYAEHGHGKKALQSFERMQQEGVSPNPVTFIGCLKACGSIGAIDRGREIHAQILDKGFEKYSSVGSTLVDMYAKCGSMSEAKEVFEKLPVRNVATWTALIGGYAEHGQAQEALKFFQQMQLEGVCPNTVTFVCVLKACGSVGAIDEGREIHAKMASTQIERDPFAGSALLDMYAKCGFLLEAREVFDKLSVRSIVPWTSLIAGYAEHGLGREAVECFEQMQAAGVSPDAITFIYGLKACGSIGAIDKGREVHAEITHQGFDKSVIVGSALVDMYSKCGSLSEACEVFKTVPNHNTVLWSAMINGYGMNNEGSMAVECFEAMQEQSIEPDAITFTCLLTACGRSSLVHKGQEYFNVMRETYGILPTVDHHTCMVDLLAQSGHLYDAHKFLECIPISPSLEMWTALLNACKIYGEAEVGLSCFQQLVQMDPEYASPYVLMANMYAAAGESDKACRIEQLRKQVGAKKKPASALIEVNKKVHEFMVGSEQSKEVAAMLRVLNIRIKKEEHTSNLDLVLRSISDEDKEISLCEHAEKVALAFGLLNVPQRQTLRVVKNMRMCNNCHNASKTISKIEGREIIIRDSYCIHHFKEGLCSCRSVF